MRNVLLSLPVFAIEITCSGGGDSREWEGAGGWGLEVSGGLTKGGSGYFLEEEALVCWKKR